MKKEEFKIDAVKMKRTLGQWLSKKITNPNGTISWKKLKQVRKESH